MLACVFNGVGTISSNNLLEQFEAHLSSLALAPATIVNYLADLRAFLRWSEKTAGVAGSPLSLDTPDIEAYCSFLQETKSSAPATINRRIQALRKFYSFTTEQGWTYANPAEDASLLSETASERSRFLTSEDIAGFLSAVQLGRRRWVQRDWAIVQVLVGAGLKLGELSQLRLEDIFSNGDQPRLRIRATNGDQNRTVPLETEVHDALCNYMPARRAAPGVDHLFVNRDGNPLSTRSIQRLLHHYAQAAGLDGLTTQALRYAYARKAYEACGDLRTVAHLLGHRHLATTIRYLRPGAPQGE
jgi:integrase/recombinase XerC